MTSETRVLYITGSLCLFYVFCKNIECTPFDMAMFEMEKLGFVCSACFVQCSVTLVAKKHAYTPTISVEVLCRIRSFCCSLNCSGHFFSERQTKLVDSVSSA